MQIELIETFLDLCETRNFNKTADRLGVTQSTVSGRVRSLERALDCRLFSRSRSGTALTTEGLRFEPHARSLRTNWAEARRAARDPGQSALTLRIGIQHDLVVSHVGDWVTTLRAALPESAFYVEADYSAQMCADVMAGDLDIAIVYTPKPHPDLHFENLGEVIYRMVSTDQDRLADIRPQDYILPNYSPAFAATHAALLPHLTSAAISSGQNAVLQGLAASLGGATYILDGVPTVGIFADRLRLVRDAPGIAQPVYAVLHLRNRHRKPHRRMLQLIRPRIPAGPVRAVATP